MGVVTQFQLKMGLTPKSNLPFIKHFTKKDAADSMDLQ